MNTMIKNEKLHLFKDKKDYEKTLTKDKVINIIGLKGSGKTTNTLDYINNEEYVIINCDLLYELPDNTAIENKYLIEIREQLKLKYKEIPKGIEFINCYNDIIKYVNNKDKKLIIEGNALLHIDLKGKVIVKRTAIIKCFFRTIKRDYPNEYFLNQEINKHGKILGRISRLISIIKRRKKIFFEYKIINNIINTLNKII